MNDMYKLLLDFATWLRDESGCVVSWTEFTGDGMVTRSMESDRDVDELISEYLSDLTERVNHDLQM